MPIEIERKFLVIDDRWREHAEPGRRFCQGHIARDSNNSVRVRRSGDLAWITIKSARKGISRTEFEYEIPTEDAEEMLHSLCAKPLLEKTRHCVHHAGMVWEIDVFMGQASGLIVAEVELAHADQLIQQPDWVGDEVTDDPRFRSSAIAINGGVIARA
jgi:adenylate cyclase